MVLPTARQDELIVKDLPHETIVYDLRSHKAHCLNQSAALIWKHCNGERTVDDLANLLGHEIQRTVSEDEVWLALDQLSKRQLLTAPLSNTQTQALVSRRELVKRLGQAAGVGLPVITSMLAPTPTQAQTGGGIPG
ncbi:MAG TPA: PqqD family protein [Blastocatellia bacterium]|nr:PqqD family protein [Blastocatellia bacterium]